MIVVMHSVEIVVIGQFWLNAPKVTYIGQGKIGLVWISFLEVGSQALFYGII